MSKKNIILTEIQEMDVIIGSMPKLNEALSFGDESIRREEEHDEPNIEVKSDMVSSSEDYSDETPIDDRHKTLVDRIRKMALEGMSELAEHTDNPNYDVLKKIWQFCDKKVEDSKKPMDKTPSSVQ